MVGFARQSTFVLDFPNRMRGCFGEGHLVSDSFFPYLSPGGGTVLVFEETRFELLEKEFCGIELWSGCG